MTTSNESARVPDSDRVDELVARAHASYIDTHPSSQSDDAAAREVLPGGNTRSVLHFDPFPFRVERAVDALLVDVDGHRYVDFCGNYSAGLYGHSNTTIARAISGALEGGWTLGATHRREIELARRICARFGSIDQVRFTNSGTEANLMAIGTALHHTGRSRVIVFDHGYHGGVLAFGDAGRGPHHPLNVPHDFHVAPFDATSGLDEQFEGHDVGVVLVEAVQGSGGCRPASTAFLQHLRKLCDTHGAVLIFDEVMTSRLAPGGAQERYGVIPDMTTLGKYLGGGMTFGAFGGRREIMNHFDPASGGALSQAGTFNNNVVSMAAALAAFDLMDDAGLMAVNERGDRLRESLNDAFARAEVPLHVTGLGSMLTIHADDDRLLELLFHAALEEGFYLARRGYMALSMAITDEHVDALVEVCRHWAESLTRGA